MSVDLMVYFRAERMMSHAVWQGAIYAAGFRVALMPFDLPWGGGYLPAKAEGAEYDSGFQFWIEPILRGMDRLDALLRREDPYVPPDHPALAAMDRYAHFQCNAREWPATVCAAVGFARATGGVFGDPYGDLITDLGQAIAYAHGESREPP